MGRVKNATVPYLASVLILAVATYAFYHGYTLLTDLIDNSFPILEVLVGFVYLCAVVKLYPILFVKTDLFIPFYNVAMYPPRRSNISKMEWANEMMRRKRQGKLPFSSKYPNGWFSVCRSTELGKGEVKPVNMLDKNLAVFRGNDGVAYVVDAYCPHLGANMSVLGKVINDNCIQCPFHGWTFRGEDGLCVDIPYCSTKSYPKQARVNSYIVDERNGVVMIWYHSEEGIQPDWEIDPIEDYDGYYEAGQITHSINCHISEIPENGADFAHFFMLHEESMLAGGDMQMTKSSLGKVMTHKWTPKNWTVGTGADKHRITFDLYLDTFFGQSSIKVPGYTEMKAVVTQMGPAYVSLKIDMGAMFQGYFIQTIQPEEQFLQRVTHRLIARPMNQLVLTKFYLQSERFQFERDIAMWNHKIYQSNPVLVKDDGPIRKYRNWYQQFYSTEQPVVKTNPNTTKPTSANDDAENEPPKHGNEPAHVEMANGIEPEKISNGLHNDLRQRNIEPKDGASSSPVMNGHANHKESSAWKKQKDLDW